jgi:hypothetical protein
MTSTPGDDDAVTSGPSRPSDWSEADRILFWAVRAGADRPEPSWGRRLQEVWERAARVAGPCDPASAREQLRRAHQAEARVDLRRVHPSWWVRALREESPAVQRVVAASAPEQVRHAVQAGLLLDDRDLAGDHPADPAVLDWVLSLWTERLVGGAAERADDPPAIQALSRLSPRSGYRLCRWAGLAKLALAGREGDDDVAAGPPGSRTRAEWLRERLAPADAEFRALVAHDVQAPAVAKLPRRRRAARIGLLTIARLLADCEPFRVRWALQHWPYPIAKLTRSLMPPASKRSTTVSRGEALVLKTAWDRLNLEGQRPMGCGLEYP